MKSAIFLTLSAVFWGLNFHLAQFMMESSSASEAAFWRYAVAVLGLLIFAWSAMPSWPRVRSQAKGILLVGVLGLFGFNYCFFKGLEYTSAVNASFIMSLNPALTVLLSSVMLREKIHRYHLIGITVAFLGVVCLISKGSIQNLISFRFSVGDGIIFLANVLFALHNVWIKRYAYQLGMINFTFLTTLACFLCFAAVMPVVGMGDVPSYPPLYWLSAIGIGWLGTSLAYYFWNRGVHDLGAARGSVFLNTVPLFTTLFAIVFGQSLYTYHLWSGVIIISGLVIMQRGSQEGN